jgi:tetratricopeptide (TPR) repeat protein
MKQVVLLAFLICITIATVRADTLSLGDTRYDGVINGIKNGKVSITVRGQEHPCELSDITGIFLDDAPKLADAEAARANDPKKSAAIYKQIIPTINKPDLKLLVEWRAIDPTDRDARWSEAIALFLDVYQAVPTDAVWNGRPTHWPAPGSSMLEESARHVNAAIKDAKSEDVKKKLRLYLLDIYTKAGDTAAAQRVAREIETGIAQEPAVAAAAPQVPAATAEITAALAAKNYDAALKQADARLANATGENAVELYAIKAQALEGLNKFHEAAGAWLRIFAHYPASPSAPEALLNAARLEKKLNNPAAKIIFDEILQKYPASKEAALVPQEK